MALNKHTKYIMVTVCILLSLIVVSCIFNTNNLEGMQNQIPTLQSNMKFKSKNGGTISVQQNTDGSQSLLISMSSGEQPIAYAMSKVEAYTNGSDNNVIVFYGPANNTATVMYIDGQIAVSVRSTGNVVVFSQDDINTTDSGSVTGPDGNTAYYANGNAMVVNTQQASARAATGPAGNTAYYAAGPNGNTKSGVVHNEYDSYPYINDPNDDTPGVGLPPKEQADLYILKSQIVPPVCPACPVNAASCPRQEKPPPCPACARCPEPSFECKKVPNYKTINPFDIPIPTMSDYSAYGM